MLAWERAGTQVQNPSRPVFYDYTFWLYIIFTLSLLRLSGIRIELSGCNALYIRLKDVFLRYDWIERVIQIIASESLIR